MNEPRMDPRKQFSKWLARVGAIFWACYLPTLLVLIYLRPEVAMMCVWLTIIVTANKMLDTLAYTDNSKTEKMLHHALDKLNLTLSLKGNGSIIAARTDAEEPDEELEAEPKEDETEEDTEDDTEEDTEEELEDDEEGGDADE